VRTPPYQIAQSLFWRKRSFSPLGTISEWSESASEGSRGTARHSLNPTGPTSWAPSFCPQPSTRQHLDLVFFSINNFRHARPLASICHFLPSLHCLLFPIARFSAVVCTRLPASREFTNNLTTSYSCLDLCPSAFQIHVRTSIRNHSICTIASITSLHDDRSRRGAAVHFAVSANCGVESARRWKELEYTTTTGHRQKTSSTSSCSQESTSVAFSWPDDK
jgi:hypothetical protein